MKKIFRYIGIFMSALLLGAMTSCNIEEVDPSGDLGLGIKVFFPTKVVTNQPMTINGSGFRDVTEIVFPDGVVVKNFELVSGEMIRVNAPAGIKAEGGKLILRSATDEVESKEDVTVGKTVISGYSRQEGELLKAGEQLTVFGTDLEFISAVELIDGDGNPLIIKQEEFYRKGTSSVVILIPRNVYEGAFIGKIYTFDGQVFDMPEFSYEPAKNAGHWETVKTVFWENGGTVGEPSWDGKYRFGLDGHDGNKECCATFPQEQWDIIKDGKVRVSFELKDNSNIRITTGWWTGAYGGEEHNCVDMIQEDEDGTKYIELDIAGEGSIHDLIDDQHLLFTGSDYTLLAIYTVEEVWIEGEEGHWERKSLWKNDGSAGAPSWDGKLRFCNVEHKTGEEIYAFPMEDWELIKEGKVHVAFDVSGSSNIRITTGWWTGAYGGEEHNCIDMIQEEEDGTKYIELDIKGEGTLYPNIDEQHLLFTGSDYTLQEIYVNVWVEAGAAPSEIVLWSGEALADDWANQPTLLTDAGPELVEAGAKVGQEVRFYITPTDADWKLKIVEGHWGPTYCAYCEAGTDTNDGEFTEWDLNANGGYIPLTLTDEILTAALTQQWWGGVFIANGDNVKVTKITLI